MLEIKKLAQYANERVSVHRRATAKVIIQATRRGMQENSHIHKFAAKHEVNLNTTRTVPVRMQGDFR